MLYAARTTGSKCLLGSLRGVPTLSRLHPIATIIAPLRPPKRKDVIGSYAIVRAQVRAAGLQKNLLRKCSRFLKKGVSRFNRGEAIYLAR